MADPVVSVEHLSFSHVQGGHEQRVLNDVTLTLSPGELVILTGPSGSGKSTLLTIIGGLRQAREGSVKVLGSELVGSGERARVKLRRQLGFIFQNHNLAPALTVARNIQMGLQLAEDYRRSDAAAIIRRAAESVDLQDHLQKLPAQLSGGQKQRAGIARALVNRPGLVLADEPTASLDKTSGQRVMDLFNELARAGSAIVLVTHDKRIIEQADRILILEEGSLVPAADEIMKDTASSLKKLAEIDPVRLGRMMSFGLAMARVALADGSTDAREIEAIEAALKSRKTFSGVEIDLIVKLAIAQAGAWEKTQRDEGQQAELAMALKAVAEADQVVSPEEVAVIEEMLKR